MVLLKNEGDPATLPLDPSKNTAVIGPLADNQHDMLGPWWGRGVDADAVSVLTGIKAQSTGAVSYAAGGQGAAGQHARGRVRQPDRHIRSTGRG